MLTLSYGSYSFAIAPDVEIESRVERSVSQARRYRIVEWRLSGVIVVADSAAMQTAIADFDAAFATDRQALSLSDGATAIVEIDPADCLDSPVIDKARVFADHGQKKFERNAGFELHISARMPDTTADIVGHVFTAKVSCDRIGRVLRETRGEFYANSGLSAEALVDSELPALPSGYTRQESGFETDDADSQASYRVLDVEQFAVLPSGVEDGFVTRIVERGEFGLLETTRGAFFGPQAARQAARLRPSGWLETDRIETTEADRKAEFVFARFVPDSRGLVSTTETVTFAKRRNIVHHKLLAPAASDYRQEAGSPDFTVVQKGRAQALDDYPEVPVPLYSGDLVESEVEFEMPEGLIDKTYEVRWRFVMRPLFEPPAIPGY